MKLRFNFTFVFEVSQIREILRLSTLIFKRISTLLIIFAQFSPSTVGTDFQRTSNKKPKIFALFRR